MIDSLFDSFNIGHSLSSVNDILHSLTQIISHLDEDYLKDKYSKNAAIDSICEILQAHKDPIDNKRNKS